MTETHMWLLGAHSPKFHVVGIFTTRQKAMETLEGLPKEGSYVMFLAPVDKFLGFIDKTGDVQDGMGRLRHEHFTHDSE